MMRAEAAGCKVVVDSVVELDPTIGDRLWLAPPPPPPKAERSAGRKKRGAAACLRLKMGGLPD